MAANHGGDQSVYSEPSRLEHIPLPSMVGVSPHARGTRAPRAKKGTISNSGQGQGWGPFLLCLLDVT